MAIVAGLEASARKRATPCIRIACRAAVAAICSAVALAAGVGVQHQADVGGGVGPGVRFAAATIVVALEQAEQHGRLGGEAGRRPLGRGTAPRSAARAVGVAGVDAPARWRTRPGRRGGRR